MIKSAHRRRAWGALLAAAVTGLGVVSVAAASTAVAAAAPESAAGTTPETAPEPVPARAADLAAESEQIADITAVHRDDEHTVTFTAGDGRLRVTAVAGSTIRVQFAPDGQFSDPNAAPDDTDAPDARMVIGGEPTAELQLADAADGYRLSTDAAVLTITRADPRMQLTDSDGTVLFTEASPLSWNADGTTQSLVRRDGEQFYGGGEQNGGYNHTGKTINVANSFNWNEGGYNNSQPYYVSTAGYGAFRNTFAPGVYDFGETVTTTEEEQRFDVYYFVGDLKQVIDSYTDLVGKPFMMPIYGLELGDSDCYLHNANRGERHTLDVLDIAQGYVDHGMPNGWMLVNDGYGCGYEDLAEAGAGLNELNMQLGLWTEDGLANAKAEAEAGVRVRKLDVAWVGPGYRFALDGCESAYDSIEGNTDARGFVYQPNSWAGAQRCAVLWSGDQYGSWDYIRWQIPTYASSTMSGIAYNTGDVDGIFGGSPKTYARDLQWKAFLPTTMTMDGWSAYDKQPWRYGEQYNAINRKYLLLKERLLPYSYTYSAQAHRTGVGQVRPLYLEYPDDPVAAGDAAKYEFLSGEDFLVAPVYSDTAVRDGIYLPEGTWIDYWTGQVYTGPTTIDGYHAPLDTLPLFVKGGAVIPMWPEGTTSWKTRDTSQLAIDVYPQGESHFDLYEDDGVTRGYADGESATQRLSVSAPQAGTGRVQVTIGDIQGSYAGQAEQRSYPLSVHTPVQPRHVRAGNGTLQQLPDAQALEQAAAGWYYDADAGVAHVKTAPVSRTDSLTVTLVRASAVTDKHFDAGGRVVIDPPAMLTPGESATVGVTFRNDSATVVRDVRLSIASDIDGVTTTPATTRVRRPVKPGESVTVPINVSAAADVQPGTAVLTATATYTGRNQSYRATYSAESTVPYPTVVAAFNNNGVTDAAGHDEGNWDGTGSFVAENLPDAGLTPGGEVTVDGLTYTWPDVPAAAADNVLAEGQTIAVSGSGNTLGFLGSGSGTSAEGEVTVSYTDGTSSTAEIGMTNWCCVDTAYGNTVAATTNGKYVAGSDGVQYPTVEYKVFADTVRIDPSKQVAAVTLPANSSLHVFALAIGSQQLPDPPGAGDSWVSDLTPMGMSNAWGPVEFDMSNGENGAGDGGPITLGGVEYAKGLGVHAPSTVSFYLGGTCTRFTATVGIDDEIADYGSVIFTVRADGVNKGVSPTLTGSSDPVQMSVDVTGAQYLDLVATPGASSISGDHGDWAGATITCSAP